MFPIIKTNQARNMDETLQSLEKHYEKFYPGTEIVIFYRKGKYHILSNGKMKESLDVSAITRLFNPHD